MYSSCFAQAFFKLEDLENSKPDRDVCARMGQAFAINWAKQIGVDTQSQIMFATYGVKILFSLAAAKHKANKDIKLQRVQHIVKMKRKHAMQKLIAKRKTLKRRCQVLLDEGAQTKKARK